MLLLESEYLDLIALIAVRSFVMLEYHGNPQFLHLDSENNTHSVILERYDRTDKLMFMNLLYRARVLLN